MGKKKPVMQMTEQEIDEMHAEWERKEQEKIDLYGVCEDCGKTNVPATLYENGTFQQLIFHNGFYCRGPKRKKAC
jgi:hypothetical protein